MARLKSRPHQRASKRKSQDRLLRESSRPSSSKRLRLQSPVEKRPLPSKKGKNKKGNSSLHQPEDAHLPPELRRAGLMAHIDIVEGKCFGPFNGRIVSKMKSPDKMHFLVSLVGDNKKKSHYFYAHKGEKDKCSWLSRLQSAMSKREQNIVAYNSSNGVCFEAIKDIKAGEELMALFDSLKGTAKNKPAVSYITDETGNQLAVQVDLTSVCVEPFNEGDDENIDVVNMGTEGSDRGTLEGEDKTDDDNGDEEEDEEYEIDDDDDDEEEEDEEEEEEDDDDDEEEEEEKDSMRMTLVNTTDDEHDSEANISDAEDVNWGSAQKRTRQKKRPKVNQVTTVDAEGGADTTKYCCSHCLEEFVDKDKAEEHSASRECLSKKFQCGTCTMEYKNASLLQRHKCGGKPKCHVCDEEFEELTQLQDHQNSPPTDHQPRCLKCDIQFENLNIKVRHEHTRHGPPENQEECPVCHKTYQKSYLKEHITTHSESDALKCPQCGKKFSSRSNLNKHRKKHLPGYVPSSGPPREKKYCCVEEGCEKKFHSKKALESHQRSHTGERPFHCEQCSWKFTQKTHLTRHIKSVHDKVPRSEQSTGRSNLPVRCETCNKIYVNSRVLAVHVQSVHQGLRPYKCEYCDATYTQRGHLWRHKHASHFDKDEVQKKYTSDKFPCFFDGCEQTFNSQPELVEHVQTHEGTSDKPCMCKECGATFVSSQNLSKHTRRRHTDHTGPPPKGHRCEKCDKIFFTSYQLVVHFRCHTGEKPYKCDLCGKDFVQKSGLRKHIRCKRCPMVEGRPNNPRSAKKYACEHCDKMFPGPSDLKAHVRTHTGEKPYACSVCQKGFSQPGNLTKHIRYVHNKEQRPKEKEREKKFFCSLCGKAFLCPSSLAMHCRTHSGDKPYSCEKCGQSFAQAGNLKKHFKRWHNDDAEARPRRKKGKGNKSTSGTTLPEAGTSSEVPQSEAAGAPNPSSLPPRQTGIEENAETPGDTPHVQTSQSNSTADAQVSSSTSVPGSVPSSQPSASQVGQTSCTPLNSPSNLYVTRPLNPGVTTSSAAQRIPVLFGYVAPLDTNAVQNSQPPPSTVRISGDSMHQSMLTGPLNTPPLPTQGGNPASMSAQELQQVVISRMLASESTDNPFVPLNVSGISANQPPRPHVLLPHVHSLLNPSGVSSSSSSGGEVTVWPFSPNNNLF